MKFLEIRETPEMFWQTLADVGLAQGNMPADPAAHHDHSAWFVKGMLGIAAWISCCFFLSLLGLLELFENAWTCAILGIIACTLASFYFRQKAASVFPDQICFVLAILGQALVLSVILSVRGWEPMGHHWLLAALFEGIVLVAIPYRPNRFLSALGALIFLYSAMSLWGIAALFMPLSLVALAVVLYRQWQLPQLWSVVALALSLAPLWTQGTEVFATSNHMGFRNRFDVLEQVGLIITWLGVVYTLLKQVTGKPLELEHAGLWILALLLAAGTWPVPLALFALAVFFLGFSQRDRLLEGIGIVQLLWSAGHYYYALQDTLLFKSLALSLLGIALLLLYAVSHHLLSKRNEGERA